MKYEIKQLNDTDVVIISNENPSNKDWYWNENTNKVKHYFENRECYPSLIHRYKVIATISPFELKGLPILKLPNQVISKSPIQELINEMKETLEKCLPEFKIGIQHAILRASAYLGEELPNQEEDIEKLANKFL